MGDIEDLWKTSVEQLGEIKEALVRTGKAGRARLDGLLQKREQERLLTELGRTLRGEAAAGRWTPPAAVADLWSQLLELERQLGPEATPVAAPTAAAKAAPAPAEPAVEARVAPKPARRRTPAPEPGEKTIGRRRKPAAKK